LTLLALLLAAAGTGQPSFDCARASTAVETMICSAPGLAARDRAIAIAYRRSLVRYRDRVGPDQRRWLAARDSCGTAACVEDSYDRRLEALLVETMVFPGTFDRPGQPGDLDMVDLGDGWHLFVIFAAYVRRDNASSGGAAGVVRIVGGRGRWRRREDVQPEDCILDFAQVRRGWSVRQPNYCSNGLNVVLEGVYRR
jgi:uncharacterized protein YecT (DUF1311 family)